MTSQAGPNFGRKSLHRSPRSNSHITEHTRMARKLQDVRHADVDEDEIRDEDEVEDEAEDETEDETGDVAEVKAPGEEFHSEEAELQIRHVSFGALQQAQDAVSKKRKRTSDAHLDQDDKLAALRDRLRQIKAQKTEKPSKEKKVSGRTKNAKSISRDGDDDGDDSDESDSDSGPSEEDAPNKSRTSKHAPTAQSTKYQVSRKRQVVDVPKRNVRDPRFDAFHQHAEPSNTDKAYSFLDDYQRDEIKELKAEIKRTKDEDDKQILRRKVNSMENRLKAKAAKEREQEVVRRHRKEEKARVEEGKTPYYLKKKEIKEQALVEKFKGMKSRERQKLIDKRQKKESQKEKKRMPDARRMASG